ncbi:MAG TPA: ABC transporter permease, partial [Vicinamibacterales bacterium]
FVDAERLVVVWETDRDTGTSREPASFPDYVDFRNRNTRLDRLASFIAGDMNLTPDGEDPARLARLSVSADLFSLLGVPLLVGRGFTGEEDRPGSPDIVIISEAMWATLYQRDPAVVGATIRLNSRPHTIVGVAPGSAAFGIPQVLAAAAYSRGFVSRDPRAQVDVWIPLRGDATVMRRENHPLIMLGRLADGVSVAAAQDDLAAIAADLERTFPSNDARGVMVEPLREVVVGPVQPALLALLAAVASLLLIACVNVANLLLARANVRGREIAVRSAVGAAPRRLAQQFLVEGTVLTLTAAILGVSLASAGLQLLLTFAPPQIPRLTDVGIDRRVLLVTLFLTGSVTAVFGLLPLIHARRVDLQAALRCDAATGGGGERHQGRRRAALVAAEVTLAVALVIAAGLLLRSVSALRQVDPGFDATGVVKAQFQLPPARYPVDMRLYPSAPAIQRFNETLLARISALPGVERAGLAGNQPLDVGFTNSFVIVGREAEAAAWPEISVRRVTPEYFDTLKVQLIAGRRFDSRDGANAPPVALINQAAVARFFTDRDPVGYEIAFFGVNRHIVGVVGNEKFHGIANEAPIAVYTPLAQTPSIDGAEALLVRASGDVRSAIRQVVRDIDPALALFGVELLDETLADSIAEQHFLMQLLGVFAMIALALAGIGVHGVLSYTLAQKTGEISVRVALGATRRDVMRLVLDQIAKVTIVGIMAGTALGLTLAQGLRGSLYGITPVDPLTLGGVVVVLCCVIAASSVLTVRRATRIHPVTALRGE